MTMEEAQSQISTDQNFEATGKKVVAHIKAGDKAKEKAIEHYKAAGLLLIAINKNHPGGFTAFLANSCSGLGRSRAYELMQIAGGRRSAEEIKAATKKRVERHRARKSNPLQAGVTDGKAEPAPADTSDGAPADRLTASEQALVRFKHIVDTAMPKMTPATRARALEYAKAVSKQLEEATTS